MERMEDVFQPGKWDQSQAIDACAKARNLAKAEELFNEMQDGQMEG